MEGERNMEEQTVEKSRSTPLLFHPHQPNKLRYIKLIFIFKGHTKRKRDFKGKLLVTLSWVFFGEGRRHKSKLFSVLIVCLTSLVATFILIYNMQKKFAKLKPFINI